MHQKLFWAFIGVLLVGCVSAPDRGEALRPPKWFSDKDSVYPPGAYLAELGEGDSLSSAKSSAAGAIAQIFRTRVTVDIAIRTRYTEITGQDSRASESGTQTDFDRTIGQHADQSLINLKFGESWRDEMGRVYTVAYLDRMETGRLYRERILENDKRVSELLARADAQDDALRGYAYLDAAVVVANANAELMEQLALIHSAAAQSTTLSHTLGDLQAKRADGATALTIHVEVFGDVDNRILTLMSDWAASKGFSVSPEGDMFFNAVVAMKPEELSNNYENLRWELTLNLLDNLGRLALSLPGGGRASGISASAAESRAFKNMTDLVQKDFDREFTAYLTSFLEK